MPMNFKIKEVMDMVSDALGDSPEGVFVDSFFLDEGEDYPDVRSSLGKISFKVCDTRDFHVKAGATKLCLIPKNTHKDWVIKIPFTGIYDYDTNEIIGEFNINYIEEEIDIYNNCVSLTTNKLLAKNVYVGSYCNIPIYVQERINQVYDESIHSYDYRPKMGKKILYSLYTEQSFCYGFLYDLLMRYGYNKLKQIMSDLNEFCFDLHDENYGYTADGTPIIIDYGGFSRVNAYTYYKEER